MKRIIIVKIEVDGDATKDAVVELRTLVEDFLSDNYGARLIDAEIVDDEKENGKEQK